MKKNLMTLAVVLCCWVTTAVLTACTSDNDDNPVTGRIVGKWYSDVSGKTSALWNYGKCWQVTELKADGTGSTDIYYLSDDKAIAREHSDFTYTAAEESMLTKGMQKADAGMAAKFNQWSNTEDMISVPQPAKFTVFVYGNAGGTMDNAIEDGFWDKAKDFLKDHNNVRVVCLYKYGKDLPEEGKPFSGKYANPGDIVWFELTSETDLSKIKEEGMQAIGMGKEAIEMKICDPKALKMFMEFSSLSCPAKEYVFGVWGHGSGFVPMNDIPNKYELPRSATRGVMYDEWNNDEELDMYEFRDAIKASGIDRLNTIFFHNCMMGNLETVTTVNDCADYICCSAHVLSSNGEVLTEFVRGLVDKGNAEDAVAQMFENITPSWQNGYSEGESSTNGDFKMYRTDKFTPILDAAKHLADRLIALYPTQKEAIDRATSKVYRYAQFQATYIYPFFDIADYAHLLAQETGDAQMKTIADEMDKAFNDAIIHYRDVNWSKEHLDHYTLSICLVNSTLYNYQKCKEDINPSYLCNFNEGYEQCDFHKYTGWGNWLRINEQELKHNPQCGGGGPLE
jgi:hypothetical protein